MATVIIFIVYTDINGQLNLYITMSYHGLTDFVSLGIHSLHRGLISNYINRGNAL